MPARWPYTNLFDPIGPPPPPPSGDGGDTIYGTRWLYQALAEPFPVIAPAPSGIFPEIWRPLPIPVRPAARPTPEGLSRFEFEPILVAPEVPTETFPSEIAQDIDVPTPWPYQSLVEPVLVAPAAPVEVFPDALFQTHTQPDRLGPTVSIDSRSILVIQEVAPEVPTGDGGTTIDGIPWFYQALAEPFQAALAAFEPVPADGIFQAHPQPDRVGPIVSIDTRSTLVIEIPSEAPSGDGGDTIDGIRWLYQSFVEPLVEIEPPPPPPDTVPGEIGQTYEQPVSWPYQSLVEPVLVEPAVPLFTLTTMIVIVDQPDSWYGSQIFAPVLTTAPVPFDWQQPLSVPVRPRTQPQRPTTFARVLPDAPAVPMNWYQPLQVPVRPRPRTHEGLNRYEFAPIITPIPPAPPLSWYQPLQVPVRPPVQPSRSPAYFLRTLPDPPAVPLNWYQPIQVPARARQQTNLGLSRIEFAPIIVAAQVTPLSWYQPIQVPVRTRPQPQARQEFAPIFVGVNLSWYRPLGEPVRSTQMRLADVYFRSLSFSFVPQIPFSNLSWYQPLAVPLTQARQQTPWPVSVLHTLTAPSLFDWYAPIVVPTIDERITTIDLRSILVIEVSGEVPPILVLPGDSHRQRGIQGDDFRQRGEQDDHPRQRGDQDDSLGGPRQRGV